MDPMTIKVLLDNHRTACQQVEPVATEFNRRASTVAKADLTFRTVYAILRAKPYIVPAPDSFEPIQKAKWYLSQAHSVMLRKLKSISVFLSVATSYVELLSLIERPYSKEHHEIICRAIMMGMTALKVSQTHPEQFRFAQHPAAILGQLRLHLTIWYAMHQVALELPPDASMEDVLTLAQSAAKTFEIPAILAEWDTIQQNHQSLMDQIQTQGT